MTGTLTDEACADFSNDRTLPRMPPPITALRSRDRELALAPTKRSFSLGRASDSDLRIDEPTVSRLHARIERIAGSARLRITDLSKNGIRYRGRVERAFELGAGEEIEIAGIVFTAVR